jgi:hypothetical protein
MVESRISKPEPGEHDAYFSTYIDRLEGENLMGELELQVGELTELCEDLSEAEGEYRYDSGKWSLKEVLGHLIDTERVFAFRALWFARGETAALPGFDQDEFVRQAEFDRRSLASLLVEFGDVRRSNVDLLSNFRDKDWQRSGISDDAELSVRAIGYILAGHVIHHLEILRERYLRPLSPHYS